MKEYSEDNDACIKILMLLKMDSRELTRNTLANNNGFLWMMAL